MDKKLRWIIALSIIAIIGGIIIWQIYSFISSDSSVLISDPVETKETIIKKPPGEPLKNASEELMRNVGNATNS